MADPRSTAQEVSVTIAIDDEDDARAVAEALAGDGGKVAVTEPPDGFAPILIPIFVHGVVTVGAFVVVIAEWWQRRHERGLLIQVDKNGHVTVKKIDTPGDHVLVVSPDGAVTDHNVGSIEELKAILTSAAGAVAEAVKGLLPSPSGSSGALEGTSGTGPSDTSS